MMSIVIVAVAVLSLALSIFVFASLGKLFLIEGSLQQLASTQPGELLGMVNQIALNTSASLPPALIAIESNTRPKERT